MTHVSQSDTLDFFRRMAAKATERITLRLANQCPTCSFESAEAKECKSRGDATPWPTEESPPICKYADRAALERQEYDRVQSRLNRLTAAGCTDPFILKWVPKATRPPMPLGDPAGAEAAMAAAEDFVADPSRLVLVLSGGTGAGKSMAAGWIVASQGGVWMPATDSNSFEGFEEIRSRMERCELLVVDDLGQERETGAGTTLLIPLLTTRIDRGRRTVVTTNLAPPALTARYGERWISRIRQAGNVYAVGNVDLRGRNRG